MTQRNRIFALTLISTLSAAPALSSTVDSEIILTDFGFRQIADCKQVWPRHVWTDGHYWSVRPSWECADEPYGGGKAPAMALFNGAMPLVDGIDDVPLMALFAPAIPMPSDGIVRAIETQSPNWSIFPPASGPRVPEQPPPRAPGGGPSPVPLPATAWLLIAALGILVFAKRNNQGLIYG